MGLQDQGEPGQFQGLVIREGGLGPLGIGLHAHPFIREAHGLLSLVVDLPLEDRQGFAPGDDPQIRGDGPVHHGFGQPVDRVEKDGVVVDVGGSREYITPPQAEATMAMHPTHMATSSSQPRAGGNSPWSEHICWPTPPCTPCGGFRR